MSDFFNIFLEKLEMSTSFGSILFVYSKSWPISVTFLLIVIAALLYKNWTKPTLSLTTPFLQVPNV